MLGHKPSSWELPKAGGTCLDSAVQLRKRRWALNSSQHSENQSSVLCSLHLGLAVPALDVRLYFLLLAHCTSWFSPHISGASGVSATLQGFALTEERNKKEEMFRSEVSQEKCRGSPSLWDEVKLGGSQGINVGSLCRECGLQDPRVPQCHLSHLGGHGGQGLLSAQGSCWCWSCPAPGGTGGWGWVWE